MTRNQAAYSDGNHFTTAGSHPDSSMAIGWGRGGNAIEMPAGVGLEMPDPGGFFELEIQYNNQGGATKLDRSGVRLCVTTEPVQDIATTTVLGTENITVMGRSSATATGTCRPSNPQQGDIRILTSIPHMRKFGTRMRTVINSSSGGAVLMDQAFNVDQQRSYDTPAILRPGDTLTTACTYNNTSDASVAFGIVVPAEVCYSFVIASPANALHNPGNSVMQTPSTCLQ